MIFTLCHKSRFLQLLLICSEKDRTEFTQTPKSTHDATHDKEQYSVNSMQTRRIFAVRLANDNINYTIV